MVERKLYKTRLCLLYQQGRCSRQYCNFAHGNAEIRRSSDGRQEYRGRDLRESLGRKRSPVRRYSPVKHTRTRHSSQGSGPYSNHRKVIDRNQRKKHKVGDFLDNSVSDRDENQNKERRLTPDSQMLLDEQLRQVQTEIMMLDNDKRRLEIFLQEKTHESDTLTLKIHELEEQLSKEKEDAKRITSIIKKFIKAHNRHHRLQEELKRSYNHVQKLGEQLDLDAAGPGINEEDSKIKNVSEDEAGVNYLTPVNEFRFNSSPSTKRSRVHLGAREASNQGTPGIGRTRLERFSGQPGQPRLINTSRNLNIDGDAVNQHGQSAFEDRHRRGSFLPSDIALPEKVPESGHSLPSTGLAAHALDEDVEVVETGEKLNLIDAAKEGIFKLPPPLPFPPPPPPLLQNAHIQYKDNDKLVDIDELDETAEVDIV